MKTLLTLSTAILICVSVQAQKGFVRGKIIDGENGESLYGATIVKKGTTIGVLSDFDGNYSLALDPGTHTIVLTFISYKTEIREDIEVKANEVTRLDVAMMSKVSQLQEVVVTSEALRDSELGMMTMQRKSTNLLDGMSNQTFRNTGDRDLASAIGRVTGVSIQNGKHVYVRGLGDRYTRTTINGMTIPGLDPDRNDVQVDIFPTALLENVTIYKTFSANLPGDFTGGMVDVETKNFPEEKITTVSFGLRYNPKMNLNNNFLSYDGGSSDWLAIDDGTREMPFAAGTVVPDQSSQDPRLESLTRSLNPTLGVKQHRSLLNGSFSFNHGNRINRARYTIGYNAIFNYQNRFEHYTDAEFGEYTKDDDASLTQFFKEEVRKGPLSRINTLWSGLLSGAIKFDNHTFSASLFRTQNGITEATERVSQNYDETNATLHQNILTYSQRSVTNGIVGGKHQFGKLRFDWKNALTKSRTYDPDFRTTSVSITDPEHPTLNRGDGAGINRFWRDLNEMNENLKVDFTLPYGKDNKLQFGASGLYKKRNFDVQNYFIFETGGTPISTSPNEFLKPENIWTGDEPSGFYLVGNYEASNNYAASAGTYGAYVMTEMKVGQKLKATYGVRVEKSDMYYTGTDIFGTSYSDMQTLDELDFLPSVNFMYSPTEATNFRASYGRTLARPSFKEKSSAQIYDPITGRFFNGNLDLQQSNINNFDIRIENFSRDGDMLSFSMFYKQFSGHIELVTYDIASNNVKPRNAGDSRVYGAELEVKKQLDFLSESLQGLTIGANVSVARSEVDMNSVFVNDNETNRVTELESRKFNARVGETVDNNRPMAGQSPYLINSYLNYADKSGWFNANLSYNVQGKSLLIIGNGAVPDVYTQPFHSLNLNVYRDFGTNGQHRVTVGGQNLLNAVRRDLYQGFGDAEGVYSILKPGRTYAVTYSLRF
ncbi:MAG TPA: TonB-dependent receptor [Chryseosolibacter sp.]|nr:TonB-dependent receptor [Chryseosolibacter sp.]